MTSQDDAPYTTYRLRFGTEIGSRVFVLVPGENRIGRMEGNEIVIDAPGVSRRHARLDVGPAGLFLEDLGSRNGTQVDGRHFAGGRIVPGQEIRLGPLRAALEEIDPGDAQLALNLASPFPVDSRTPDGRTPDGRTPDESTDYLSPAAPASASALPSLEDLLGRMAATGVTWRDPPALLGLLTGQLAARAAALVEWHPTRGAVVIAARGKAGAYLDDPIFHDLLRQSCQQSTVAPRCHGAVSEDYGAAYAVLTFPEKPGDPSSRPPPLGLVVRGPEGAPPADPAFLGLVARLLDLTRREERRGPGRIHPERPELVFPDDWAPSSSTAMEKLYDQLRALVGSDLPVLIVGETGVGKERIPGLLHASSRRRHLPLVAINCAAVPADLLEAELFGIGDRVATGVRARPGRFRDAAGGTVFLDEIGDMSPTLQAKLLRVLQEKEVQGVGEAPVAIDVRTVAATNVDLNGLLDRGTFRRDLYYRIAGSVVRVPPLRERRADIPALVEHFLRGSEKSVRGVTVRALELLCAYAWPGNIRELEHEVERLAAFCPDGGVIESTMLAEPIRGAAAGPPAATSGTEASSPNDETLNMKVRVHELERALISRALVEGGSQVRAARLLGIARNTLIAKMKQLEIDPPDD